MGRKHRITVAAVLGLLTAVPAGAGTRRIQLEHCWEVDGAAFNADFTQDTTSEGTTANISEGWNFEQVNDTQIRCTFTVPDDYDDSSATEPTVHVLGWSTNNVLCVFNCSTEQRFVELEVSYVAYGPGVLVDDDFSDPPEAGTGTWDTENLDGDDYWRSDRLKEIVVDANADASDWDVGDLVILRINRNTSTNGDLSSIFHVADITLQYVHP